MFYLGLFLLFLSSKKYLYVNLLGWGYDGYVPAWVEVDLFFTATVSKVNNVKLHIRHCILEIDKFV